MSARRSASILIGTGTNGVYATVVGGAGADTVYGGVQGETIGGNGGNDTIDGGDGNDQTTGGDDNDIIQGGTGSDFTFIGANAFTGAGGTNFEVRVQSNGNGTYTVQADVNHDGAADFSILVHAAAPLQQADFVL